MINNKSGNRNILELSDKKKNELGILKVLSVIIAENEDDKYMCIMEDGSKKVFPASKLVE